MSSINSVTIVGKLTRDPEARTLGETTVCTLSVAVNERVKKNGEWTERANFFDVDAWGAQADACARYLSKGRQVAVSGSLRWESWEKDGQNRSKVVIRARDVMFIGARQEATAETVTRQAQAAGLDVTPEPDDDDIPF